MATLLAASICYKYILVGISCFIEFFKENFSPTHIDRLDLSLGKCDKILGTTHWCSFPRSSFRHVAPNKPAKFVKRHRKSSYEMSLCN